MDRSRLKQRLRNQPRLKLPVFSQGSTVSSKPTKDNRRMEQAVQKHASSSRISLESCPSFQHFVAQEIPEEVSALFTFR